MTGPLILIGLPGSGKTTIARALQAFIPADSREGSGGSAAETVFQPAPLYDLDAMIEQAEGRTVQQIFVENGEGTFREKEKNTVKTLCKACSAHGGTCIIATGGGTVLLPENRELLRSCGTVFWLDRHPDNIMLTDFTAGRPLLAGGEAALRTLARQRRELYARCAHYRIADGTVEEMTEEIVRIWRETP